LGVDLGTCDVVSMVVDRDGLPVAVCLDWADVVRRTGEGVTSARTFVRLRRCVLVDAFRIV
ncbi:hypothetical protein, partial [Streptococcus pneumoniae]|uniref:hypothetical protein n=1 Tax=Streptococcus pneumoniae TaxID=1313 RepID=UPI001E44C5AB